MIKIALNAGHYLYTAGKRCLKSLDPNETREWILNARICEKVEQFLSGYVGYELLRIDDRTGKTDVSLKNRTKAANNWGATVWVSVHHNAGIGGGSGGGIVVYTYPKVDEETKTLQKKFYDKLIDKTGLRGNRATPLATSDLHECRETVMPAILMELGFMDSTTDVPIILTEEYANKCAAAICEVLIEHYGLKVKEIIDEPEKIPVEESKSEESVIEPAEPESNTPEFDDRITDEPEVSEEADEEELPKANVIIKDADEVSDYATLTIAKILKLIIELIKNLFKKEN